MNVIGGADYFKQKQKLEDIPHVVVGTPGRLYEQLNGSDIAKKYLRNLKYLVLDEVDFLMNETLMIFVQKILEMLPTDIQVVYCSATVDDMDVGKFKNLKIGGEEKEREFVKVSLHKALEKAKSVALRYCLMPELIKDCYLVELLKRYDGNDIIIFFNNCE